MIMGGFSSSSSSTDIIVDFSPYPPSPVVWAYTAIDTICDPLGCAQWRQWLPTFLTNSDGAWLSEDNKIPQSVFTLFPNMMTYQEFLELQRSSSSSSSTSPFSWTLLKQFAFETPSTSLADLTSWNSILVLIVLVWLMRRLKATLIPFFSQIGRTAGRHTHGKEWEKANEIRITKFGEYVFRLCFHSAISVAGIWLFWDKPWWSTLWNTTKDGAADTAGDSDGVITGTKTLFLDYPFQPVEPDMIWYYLVQAAYNIEAMVCLLELSFDVHFQPLLQRTKTSSNDQGSPTYRLQFPIRVEWSDTVRGDFREMCIHHIITNLLVIGSSFYRFTRVGSMVRRTGMHFCCSVNFFGGGGGGGDVIILARQWSQR
jgi:hypothetical protein